MKVLVLLCLISPIWGLPEQAFLREPFDQMASVGEHVTLPCRVVNKKGVLQWTRDGFGLGTDRNLTGYHRYRMSGSDEEGKPLASRRLCQMLDIDIYCQTF